MGNVTEGSIFESHSGYANESATHREDENEAFMLSCTQVRSCYMNASIRLRVPQTSTKPALGCVNVIFVEFRALESLYLCFQLSYNIRLLPVVHVFRLEHAAQRKKSDLKFANKHKSN
jgi:hypothetical protein